MPPTTMQKHVGDHTPRPEKNLRGLERQSNMKSRPTSRVRKKTTTFAIIRFFTTGVIMYLKPKLVVEYAILSVISLTYY